MNTQYLMTVAFGTLLAVAGVANAGEKELSKDQVPQAVIAAFEKAYPAAKDVEFEAEMFAGKSAYEVEFKQNGKECELIYSADGTLLQKEEGIDVQALPKAVSQAITKAHPKAKIKEAEKLMKPDGTVTGYEVEIVAAGKELELELDNNGKILQTEEED